MASERDLKQLVKPLLEGDEDLHYVSQGLVVGPVRHFVSFVDFGASQRSRELQMYLHLVPLYGNGLRTPAAGHQIRRYVSMDEAGYPDTLRDEIRNDYVPFLKIRALPEKKKLHIRRLCGGFRRILPAFHRPPRQVRHFRAGRRFFASGKIDQPRATIAAHSRFLQSAR